MSLDFTLATKDCQYIKGFVCYITHPMNLIGSLFVICEKHDKKINVELSIFDDGFSRRDKILQAFNNCPVCKEVDAWEKTKFPEGAEL